VLRDVGPSHRGRLELHNKDNTKQLRVEITHLTFGEVDEQDLVVIHNLREVEATLGLTNDVTHCIVANKWTKLGDHPADQITSFVGALRGWELFGPKVQHLPVRHVFELGIAELLIHQQLWHIDERPARRISHQQQHSDRDRNTVKSDRTYGIGSEKGMAIRAVTAALQAAAQNDTAGSLVALASPYLNQTIHEMTAGDTAKDKATNLMAHALLSAVEFQVTGKDPLTGAVAGVTGEATAEIIARAYGKPVSELTANEKENISTLSQLAGGLAAALTAKANGTTTEQGGNFLAATAGQRRLKGRWRIIS